MRRESSPGVPNVAAGPATTRVDFTLAGRIPCTQRSPMLTEAQAHGRRIDISPHRSPVSGTSESDLAFRSHGTPCTASAASRVKSVTDVESSFSIALPRCV